MVVLKTPHSDGLRRAQCSHARTKAEKQWHPSVMPYGYAIYISQCHCQKLFTSWVPLGSIEKFEKTITQERDFLPRLKSRVSISSNL